MTRPSDVTDGRPVVIRADDHTALVVANLERSLERARAANFNARLLLEELRRYAQEHKPLPGSYVDHLDAALAQLDDV